jgi:acyl-CoA synthetase (AMP-forming)/AMP-acid ligase II
LRELLPGDARFWTPYGATECLPVAMVEGRELEATRTATEAGAGTCVGWPVAPNEVRIIGISDAAIPEWSDGLRLPDGEVGEITVAGPTVTDTYFNRDAQTRLAKIHEVLPTSAASASTSAVERIVHRKGDVGYLYADGRMWICGRKSHRVETGTGPLYTEQVEPVFNTHPDVRRTALVGVGEPGAQVPVLCVELAEGVHRREWSRIECELGEIAAAHPHTAGIARFLRHTGFPVDIRHNAKIGREKLALWAAKQTTL